MADETEKVTITFPEGVLQLLRTAYPGALNDQEAVRHAVDDGLLLRRSWVGFYPPEIESDSETTED